MGLGWGLGWLGRGCGCRALRVGWGGGWLTIGLGSIDIAETYTLDVVDNYRGQVVLDHLPEGLLHLLSQLIVAPLLIILFTVIPNQLQMIQHLLYYTILPILHLLLYPIQVHRIFYHFRVVIKL